MFAHRFGCSSLPGGATTRGSYLDPDIAEPSREAPGRRRRGATTRSEEKQRTKVGKTLFHDYRF